MKKNLRIVSAAAAALLAVAPVAAYGVSSVSAVTTATQLGKVPNLANGDVVNVKPNISLNTSVPSANIKAAISVSFTASYNGTTATSNFKPDASEVELYQGSKQITDLQDVNNVKAGTNYKVRMTRVGLNFGSQNANKKVTLTMPDGDYISALGSNVDSNSVTVKLDQNGTVTLGEVIMNVTAKDFANPAITQWHNKETGAVVTSGDVTLYSGSDAGKMNVAQVVKAIRDKYIALSLVNTNSDESFSYSNVDDVTKQLEAQGMTVTDGWFVANKSFTVNYKATAAKNDASSTLTVTVNVPNGKDTTVPSQSKTVMHNAYFYDKNGKRVGSDKVTRYNSATVAMSTTTISGKAYYEVIENGKATGKFINAANIDGTKRTLKHNAYVYKSSKKRANKVVLKKGTEVVTYGGAYTFKNGKQYYKIGNNTDKTYVKASNF